MRTGLIFYFIIIVSLITGFLYVAFFTIDEFFLISKTMSSSVTVILFVFFIFFIFIQFFPQAEINFDEEFFIVVLTIVFIPLFIIMFAFCYISFGLDNQYQKSDYLYFSIVTFTTLGYGDIKPDGYSKFFAASEALLGFLFVPILISQFVRLAADVREGAARRFGGNTREASETHHFEQDPQLISDDVSGKDI